MPPNIISLCSSWLPKNGLQGRFSIYCRLFPPGASSNSLRNLLEVSCNIFHTIIYLRNLLESTSVTLTGGVESKKRSEGGREKETGGGTEEVSRGRETTKRGSGETDKGRGGMVETKRSGRCFPLKGCKRELHTGTNKTMLCQLPIAC